MRLILKAATFIIFIFISSYGSIKASFEQIDKNIYCKIFDFLPEKDLRKCAQVSKKWRENSEENLIWDKKLSMFLGFDMQIFLKMSPVARSIHKNNKNLNALLHQNEKLTAITPYYPGTKILMRHLIERQSTTRSCIAEQLAISALNIHRPGSCEYREDLIVESAPPEETKEFEQPFNITPETLEAIILTSERLGCDYGTAIYLLRIIDMELEKKNLVHDQFNPEYYDTQRAVFYKYRELGWEKAIEGLGLFRLN